jgi:hypothetical protein
MPESKNTSGAAAPACPAIGGTLKSIAEIGAEPAKQK